MHVCVSMCGGYVCVYSVWLCGNYEFCVWYVCWCAYIDRLLFVCERVDINLKTFDSVCSSLETLTLAQVPGPSCSG